MDTLVQVYEQMTTAGPRQENERAYDKLVSLLKAKNLSALDHWSTMIQNGRTILPASAKEYILSRDSVNTEWIDDNSPLTFGPEGRMARQIILLSALCPDYTLTRANLDLNSLTCLDFITLDSVPAQSFAQSESGIVFTVKDSRSPLCFKLSQLAQMIQNEDNIVYHCTEPDTTLLEGSRDKRPKSGNVPLLKLSSEAGVKYIYLHNLFTVLTTFRASIVQLIPASKIKWRISHAYKYQTRTGSAIGNYHCQDAPEDVVYAALIAENSTPLNVDTNELKALFAPIFKNITRVGPITFDLFEQIDRFGRSGNLTERQGIIEPPKCACTHRETVESREGCSFGIAVDEIDNLIMWLNQVVQSLEVGLEKYVQLRSILLFRSIYGPIRTTWQLYSPSLARMPAFVFKDALEAARDAIASYDLAAYNRILLHTLLYSDDDDLESLPPFPIFLSHGEMTLVDIFEAAMDMPSRNIFTEMTLISIIFQTALVWFLEAPLARIDLLPAIREVGFATFAINYANFKDYIQPIYSHMGPALFNLMTRLKEPQRLDYESPLNYRSDLIKYRRASLIVDAIVTLVPEPRPTLIEAEITDDESNNESDDDVQIIAAFPPKRSTRDQYDPSKRFRGY